MADDSMMFEDREAAERFIAKYDQCGDDGGLMAPEQCQMCKSWSLPVELNGDGQIVDANGAAGHVRLCLGCLEAVTGKGPENE